MANNHGGKRKNAGNKQGVLRIHKKGTGIQLSEEAVNWLKRYKHNPQKLMDLARVLIEQNEEGRK